jgi:hypothetical protein
MPTLVEFAPRRRRLFPVVAPDGRYLGNVGQGSAFTGSCSPSSPNMSVQNVLDATGVTAMLKGGTGSIRRQTAAEIQAAIQAGQLSFNPAGCTGVNVQNAQIARAAAGVAGSVSGLVLSIEGMASAIPIAGAIIGGGLAIYNAIFSHHAAAVAKEQQVVCAAVPAANTALSAIIQAVQAGTITPQQGIASLQQLYQDFSATVQPILKSDASHCNAACGWRWQLCSIVMYLSSQWEAAAASPSGAGLPGSTAAAPSPTPSWGWLLALGAGAALLFAFV